MRSPAARSRRARPSAALLAGCVLGTATLGGCAAFSEEGRSQDGLRVVAAFYPLQYVADRVAGDLAVVDNITAVGKEPHDLELSVKETALVSEADLVVHEAGFQPAVDATVRQNATGTVLDAAEVVELAPLAEEHEHEEAHAEEGHEEEGHEEGHDHGGSGLDPHFWQDPLRMAELGDAVAAELAEVDPDNAEEYAANADELRADLEQLDGEYAGGLAGCERDTVVVSHDAFGYLGRYGLHMEPVAGLSPDAEPTPADLQHLQEVVRAEGLTTVFSERLVSPRLTETLADDLGVRTAVLDPVEGLSDETAAEDYLSLMRQNLAALREANGCA